MGTGEERWQQREQRVETKVGYLAINRGGGRGVGWRGYQWGAGGGGDG
jgi:hypothetical protein